MSEIQTPLSGFAAWLPGELRYSVQKAPYTKKVERAVLPLEDPTSMYGFIENEWFTFQQQKKDGAHYMPFHGKSAQLQLAKFAAGFFDKVALGEWIHEGRPKDMRSMDRAAAVTAGMLVDTRPWEQVTTDVREIIELPFDETPFATGIVDVMRGINTAYTISTDSERKSYVDRFQKVALEMGTLATVCYARYAEEFLTPEQYNIPVSERAV